MKTTVMFFIACLTVCLLLLGLSGSLYSQQGEQVKIGVVDLEETSSRFKKWIRYSEEFDKEKEVLNKQIEEKAREIERLSEMLKQFKPGSEQHQKVQIEIQTKTIKYQNFIKEQDRQLRQKLDIMGGELFNDIETVVSEYGRQNGFTLILRKEKRTVKGLGWVKLQMYYSTNPVIYHSANIDLTEKVLEILNKKFK